MPTPTLIIATRGSKLALWQATFVQQQLQTLGQPTELKIIKTKGDLIQHLGFDKMEGKGFFTKEIENALLCGEADLAVHSMKDMPTTQPEGLAIAAVSQRENPADWLIINKNAFETNALFKLKANACVGTSSARRKAQLLHFRPDAQLKDIRGNVPTRLEKLQSGEFDAIFLAAAGLHRLEIYLSAFEVVKLNPKEFVPAPAQGVLAIQVLENNVPLRTLLQKLHHSEVSACTNVERKTLQLLSGGCQMPVGVYCERDVLGNFHAWASRASAWNAPVTMLRQSASTSYGLAESLAAALMKNNT